LPTSGNVAIQVSDIQPALPDPSLVIDFSPTTIPPKTDLVVATVTYFAKAEGHFKGKVRTFLPYKAMDHN